MAKVVKELEMAVSPKALYSVITDFENYPKFMPEVVGVEILPGATKSKVRVKFEIELLKKFAYVLEFSMKPNEEVSWKLVESNFFKNNSGRWHLVPKGAKATQVAYELDVAFGFMVPSWITKKLTETNLPKMLGSFEEQAKAVKA